MKQDPDILLPTGIDSGMDNLPIGAANRSQWSDEALERRWTFREHKTRLARSARILAEPTRAKSRPRSPSTPDLKVWENLLRDHFIATAALIGVWLFLCVLSPTVFATDATRQSPAGAEAAKAPPEDKFVNSGGVRLHYVDWGGQGRVVLFLAGFGNDAHVFDAFAPQFTASFHSIGLTRRGFGRSDKPSDGYDVATRVQDIVSLLDAIGADRVDVVGHSMAGDEMTVLASTHPDRVIRLVYLDAAYDHSRAIDLMLKDPGTPPLFERLILEARHSTKARDIEVPDMPPPADWDVLVKTIRALGAYRIDYSRVTAPALAIYADPGHYPGIEEGTPDAKRRSMEVWWQEYQHPSDLANIRQFRRQAEHGQVVTIKGAPHYLFMGQTQGTVAAKVNDFLRQDRGTRSP